jgi:GAF domain-containing protein
MVLKDMSDQFAAVARSLRSEPNELETLSRAIEVAVEVVPSCDYAGITMVRDRHRIQTPAATAAVARRCDQLQLELDEGPCLDVLRETEAISCVDLLQEDRWPTWAPRVALEVGIRSTLCFRLFTTTQSLGALNLYARKPAAFDARDYATGLAFAAHLAVALSSSRDIEGQGQAMVNRTTIGQAEGILMERFGLTPEQAFTFLKRISQDTNTKLADVAIELVQTRITPGTQLLL